MSTSELQIDLIHKITGINDEGKLKEIMQLIEFQMDETPYITSSDEQNAVAEAKQQIAQGETHSHKEVQEKVEEWLKK